MSQWENQGVKHSGNKRSFNTEPKAAGHVVIILIEINLPCALKLQHMPVTSIRIRIIQIVSVVHNKSPCSYLSRLFFQNFLYYSLKGPCHCHKAVVIGVTALHRAVLRVRCKLNATVPEINVTVPLVTGVFIGAVDYITAPFTVVNKARHCHGGHHNYG